MTLKTGWFTHKRKVECPPTLGPSPTPAPARLSRAGLCPCLSGGGAPPRRVLTGKDLMDHTISLFSGTHLTLPTVVLNLGESASLGTGMWISTLLAVDRRLNWLLAWRRGQCGQGCGGRR